VIPLPDQPGLGARLRDHVERLALSPRPPQSPGHARAAEHVRRHLERSGYHVEEQLVALRTLSGRNLLTRPVPDRPDRPLLIVGAHYDSLPNSPGADDNASAVAALLEAAAWAMPLLGRDDLSVRVQFAAYDMEELGLVGSRLHAEHLLRAGADVRGMIALEMLGYTSHKPGSQQLPPDLIGLYPDVGDFIGVCGNEASRELQETVTAGLKSVPGLPVEFIVVPGRGEVLAEVRLSDHSSFWDVDYPAVMITDTSFFRNPHYHQPSDTPATLDYAFLTRVTVGVCEALRRLVR
jgi:Zn-dependent M28 family amino/carboxypeptidase